MIPDEAVDTAARRIVKDVTDRSWESLWPSRQDWYRELARAALKAAAPHLQAVVRVESLCDEAANRGIESGPPLTLSAIRDALRPTDAV